MSLYRVGSNGENRTDEDGKPPIGTASSHRRMRGAEVDIVPAPETRTILLVAGIEPGYHESPSGHQITGEIEMMSRVCDRFFMIDEDT